MVKCYRESEVGKVPRVCEGNDKFLAVPGTVDLPLPKSVKPLSNITNHKIAQTSFESYLQTLKN